MNGRLRNTEPNLRFLDGGGVMGKLVRAHDWSATPVGPIEGWPQSMKTAVGLALMSPVPIVTLWGPEGMMIYNDGYSGIAGSRHPGILGRAVRDAWAEAAELNDRVMRVCLGGGVLAFRDLELTLHRRGEPEQVWLNLDYSPILDETGAPAGVVAIVVETTQRVLADRRIAAEHERVMRLFEQAPSFMAMLSGDDHVIEMMNPGYRQLIGSREALGKPVREAVPEAIAQGYVAMLDGVRASGEAISGLGAKFRVRRDVRSGFEDRYVDFVYQPITDAAGAVTHIFVQGSDVTDRVMAERQQRLLINELNHRVKNTFATVQTVVRQTLRGQTSPEVATGKISARILALSRAQDLLTAESWSGAEVGAVVRAAIDAHGATDRFDVAGPPLRLGARPALALALALHELGTNATKYGALSTPGGRIRIEWRVGGDDAGPTFELEWRESGGRDVAAPTVRGFGSTLIERGFAAELDAEVRLDYAPSGLVVTARAALGSVEETVQDV